MIRLLPILLLSFLFCAPALATDTVPVEKTEDAAPALPPLRGDAGLTKAEGQLTRGEYMQAVETLGAVLARRPADPDALTYVGYAWMEIGDARKAGEYFDRALQYDPKHLGANKYKADLFLEAGDFARALEQLQVIRVICAQSPDCAELNMLQAEMNAYKKAGKLPAAEKKEEKKPVGGGNR
jgi:Tfp pilus assembly protein PilF